MKYIDIVKQLCDPVLCQNSALLKYGQVKSAET